MGNPLACAADRPEVPAVPMIIIKIGIFLFILFWLGLGGMMLVKWNSLFGANPDDPSESPGSRTLSIAHIGAVWIGGLALAIYFLI
ncbi:MAG: hypothetical protein CFE26_11675 [Verrucomicrobiales bacterium VVV1]|nr:MAG: hypothetical protein CFE26_11675 [Verrucomicrobiales bacterium VVV1]